MMCDMDPERVARVASIAGAVHAELGAVPGAEELQRQLFERGVHGIDAVLVTMQVLGVGLREANAAFFDSPLRSADRELQNSFIDVLESAALTLPAAPVPSTGPGLPVGWATAQRRTR